MNFDLIKTPIEAESLGEQKKELKSRIFQAQLFFIEEKIKKERPNPEAYLALFEEVTGSIEGIKNRYFDRLIQGNADPKYQDEARKLEDDFANDLRANIKAISAITEGEERIGKISDYIRLKESENPRVKRDEGDNQTVGLMSYNTSEAHDFGGDFGLESWDDLLEIHISPVFMGDNNFSLRELKSSLGKIAELVVTKYPETRAVVGVSWLFSHPIMKRLGFATKEKEKKAYSGTSYWEQLIDKDGQIDNERLDFLMSKGELPYKKSWGMISVEDLLRKYLPNSHGREVILKRKNPESEKRKNEINEEIENKLKKKWNKFIKQEASVEEVLFEIPLFVAIAKELGFESEIKDFFKECLNKKLTLEQIKEDEELMDQFKAIFGKIENKVQESEYIDYKITL